MREGKRRPRKKEMENIRIQVMEIGFDDVTLDEAVSIAMQYIERGEKCRVVTPNPEIARMCRNDSLLCDIVNSSQLVLPDGIGVVYTSRILGHPLRGRVPGFEFAEKLLERMQNTGYSVFFFGAKPGVAEKAAEKMQKKYPGLLIAGTLNGYYTNEGQVVADINDARPDVLFVCLGAPKQEQFMALRGEALNVTLMAGLGGTLDGLAGEVKRAPDFFIRLNLEWLYRLLCQPKRIGRVIKLPLYLLSAFAARKKKKNA